MYRKAIYFAKFCRNKEGHMEQGYQTLTYRYRLPQKSCELLTKTQLLYNELLSFYYHLYFEFKELAEIPKSLLLREMEKLTIPGRDGAEPIKPLPYTKVPLYFRRAAINGAIYSIKAEGSTGTFRKKDFTNPVTYYKGMYRDFSPEKISMKLWDGISWKWYSFYIKGRPWPAEGRQMSPSVLLNPMERYPMLHVPVECATPDIRKIREKFQDSPEICAVCFTNTDAFAVCAVIHPDGSNGSVRFVRGGNEYSYLCKKTLQRIEKSRKACGIYKKSPDVEFNKKHWKYLRNLSDHYAHQVSREILDFCKANRVTILAVPDHTDQQAKIFRQDRKWTPLYLSQKILRQLDYKAWGAGISIAKVRCYQREDRDCTINPYLQTARNIGQQCQKNHGKTQS